jgi:hypothetical protein
MKKDGDEGASLPSVPSIMPQKGQRMKAKLRSLGGFSFLARRDPGEGGVEGLAEPLALLPGVRLDVALGDVNQHRDLPPVLIIKSKSVYICLPHVSPFFTILKYRHRWRRFKPKKLVSLAIRWVLKCP